jgi:hypothetical protein
VADERPISGTEPGTSPLVGQQPSVPNDADASDETVSEIQIVGGEDDDPAGRRHRAQPIGNDPDRAIVETGEWLVEQNQPRLMKECAFEGQPLSHASGKARHDVVCTI